MKDLKVDLNNIVNIYDILFIIDNYTREFLSLCEKDMLSAYNIQKFKANLKNLRHKYMNTDSQNGDWVSDLYYDESASIVTERMKYYNILYSDNQEKLEVYNNGINYLVLKNILKNITPLDIICCYIQVVGQRYDWQKEIDDILMNPVEEMELDGFNDLNIIQGNKFTIISYANEQDCIDTIEAMVSVYINQYITTDNGEDVDMILPLVLYTNVLNKPQEDLSYILLPKAYISEDDAECIYVMKKGISRLDAYGLKSDDLYFVSMDLACTEMRKKSERTEDNILVQPPCIWDLEPIYPIIVAKSDIPDTLMTLTSFIKRGYAKNVENIEVLKFAKGGMYDV